MDFETISVESYSGYKANERPSAFIFRDTRKEVAEILDRWYEGGTQPGRPEVSYFKVKTTDGEVFLLRDLAFSMSGRSGSRTAPPAFVEAARTGTGNFLLAPRAPARVGPRAFCRINDYNIIRCDVTVPRPHGMRLWAFRGIRLSAGSLNRRLSPGAEIPGAPCGVPH